VSLTEPPLKHTSSGDSEGPSEYSRSNRDRGSAVGTNFEVLQEEIYRKWILGEKDRKVSHPTR
jgi:hypothetical protein